MHVTVLGVAFNKDVLTDTSSVGYMYLHYQISALLRLLKNLLEISGDMQFMNVEIKPGTLMVSVDMWFQNGEEASIFQSGMRDYSGLAISQNTNWTEELGESLFIIWYPIAATFFTPIWFSTRNHERYIIFC